MCIRDRYQRRVRDRPDLTMPVDQQITTPVTQMLGIQHPVVLAGMNVAASPALAAAVSNAGGLGVFGGVNYTPKIFRAKINELKAGLNDPSLPFGVDLLLPQVGGSARKTNYDYTHGDLPELIDITVQSGAKLFVSAVGVPPKFAVDKLHAAGILVMNMVGHPKHVSKALAAGVDMICVQGGEGGGHTGEIASSILIPMVVDACRGKLSPLTGKQVPVVAGGGIYDGRGLAMSLALGADAVWVGTRFVASVEGGAPDRHKEDVVKAGLTDTHRSLVFTGRPLRVIKTPYTLDWEENRKEEMKARLAAGELPWVVDQQVKQDGHWKDDKDRPVPKDIPYGLPWLSGQVAGAITDILPARQIVEEMVNGATRVMRQNAALISKL
eukprot:TRINITY_DN10513_c0_g1_i2.p1 TRINITY_DN10513_c0_g1~~TRINITY_DN10513_c0_g1_i2.p1  ORF type:complete len:382 (+),score=109.89 TRINITY_DN10513_c0_g1_i2:143-1288(+)